MKKLFALIGILALGTMIAYPQNETKATKENAAKAEITFEKTVHDFGTIPFQGDGSCQFVFKNTGKEPLVLSNVNSSCGCTVPEWTKDPIEPGKTGTIKVKYNTHIAGQFTKTITVFSNATNSPVALRITGTVESPKSK